MTAALNIPLPKTARKVVRKLNLGVYLDRPANEVPPRGLTGCLNVRVKDGWLKRDNMGWEPFPGATASVLTSTTDRKIYSGHTYVVCVGGDIASFEIGRSVSIPMENGDTHHSVIRSIMVAGPGAIVNFTDVLPWSVASGVTVTSYSLNIIQLDSRVLLIDQLFTRTGTQTLIFGTRYNLYYYHDTDQAAYFINPVFNTGTCDVTNGSKNLTFNGAAFGANDIKAGDKFHSGANNQYDPAATWYTIDTVNVGANTAVLTENYAEATQAADPYTLRQLFSGAADDYWDADTFPDAQPQDEDTWYATNTAEVVKWDGSDDTVTWVEGRGITLLGFVPKVMIYHKNSMLYGNILESGESKIGHMKVSDAATPETILDEFAVTDGIDELLTFAPLGDLMVAYCERSINLIQWVDDPLYFIIRTAVPGIGLTSGRAIMDFGDFHEFLGHDCAYSFDGVGIEEVGPQVFRDVLRTIAPDRVSQAIAHIDEENGEVQWIVPKTTDVGDVPETAYTTHYLEDVGQRNPVPMTIRDLPATATGFYERESTLRFSDLTGPWSSYGFRWNDRFFQAAFPYNLFGDDNGYIYILGTADSQNGEAIFGWARLGRMALGDGRHKGTVTRIEPFTSKRAGADNYSLLVGLYTTDFAEGDLTKVAEEEFDLTHGGNRFVPIRQSGLYGEVEFGTNGIDRSWSVAGYAAEMVLGGGR